MLRIKNESGEELMRLHDNGEEEFVDKKFKEKAQEKLRLEETKDDE